VTDPTLLVLADWIDRLGMDVNEAGKISLLQGMPQYQSMALQKGALLGAFSSR